MVLRLNRYRFFLRLYAYLLPVLAFGCTALLLSRYYPRSVYLQEENVYLLALTAVLWGVAAEHYKVCSVDELFREFTGIRAVFAACVATYAVNIAVVFFAHAAWVFSRVFLALSGVLLFLFALLLRAVFRHVVRQDAANTKALRVMIVGTDQFACRVAERLESTPFRCVVAGYVRLPNEPVDVEDAPVHELDELEQATMTGVDDIVIAISPARFSDLAGITRRLATFRLPIRAIIDFGEHTFVREQLFQFGRLQFLDLERTPAESLAYALLKRGFDIAFSSIAILVSAPLMAFIVAAIKLTSPGPVLFRQDRVGLNGRAFSMLKFRSMEVSPATKSDTTWTVRDDPRRTRIGALLRKTSLDELPQFFNVLKGDMSVVGPRPERPHFVHQFLKDIDEYDTRHKLKAGITGWAQVNGWRGDTSIKKRLEYDLHYLQNWSFAFDLRIIFLTVWSGMFGKNAF